MTFKQQNTALSSTMKEYDVCTFIIIGVIVVVININYLLSYFNEHPDYIVKNVKDTDFNIEYRKSMKRRKNVLAELYPETGRFYLNKNNKWVNIKNIYEVQTDADVIAWIENDSENLGKQAN
jgi:hypothetical protein